MADGKKEREASGQKRLLLIEDEGVLLELLRARLVAAGYAVTVAQDGTAGLALIKETHPDLVLLDMMLPGISGFEILEHMQKAGLLPDTPVLIISNSGQPIELERALRLGVRDYLIKVNFDPHEVLVRVENILRAEYEQGGGETIAPRQASAGAPGPAKHTILVVEDDFLLVGLLERRFLAEGYHVVKAVDAAEARRALAIQTPDAILLDMVLPGMDGFAFLAELKKDNAYRAIPVVVISNLGQQEEIRRGRDLGADEYIVKANISPAEIVQKVAAILKDKSK